MSHLVNINDSIVYIGPVICTNLRENSDEFKFYKAAFGVTWGLYGMEIQNYPTVAAVYETAAKDIWAVGKNVTEVRNSLVAKVYAEYKDVIKVIARHNISTKKR